MATLLEKEISARHQKTKKSSKVKKQIAEGLSPIYKNGRITPETRGLGPEYQKDIKLKVMPMMPKIEKKMVPKPKIQPNQSGKRYFA